MGSSERAKIQQALDELAPYLAAYVRQTLGTNGTGAHYRKSAAASGSRDDLTTSLKLMKDNWTSVFQFKLPRHVRSYVFETADIRNGWAHQEPFTADDAQRALSTIHLLAGAIGAPPLASGNLAVNPARTGPPTTRSTGRASSQREVMRSIYAKCKGDEERAVRDYAAAERRGDVERRSNTYSISPEAYARALLSDGIRKGWLQS